MKGHGRILLRKMEEFIAEGASFGFETTLSGRAYVNRIRTMRKHGYRIVLFYLKLPSAEMAIERVRARVVEGGHRVPKRTSSAGFPGVGSISPPCIDPLPTSGLCLITAS